MRTSFPSPFPRNQNLVPCRAFGFLLYCVRAKGRAGVRQCRDAVASLGRYALTSHGPVHVY